MHSFTKHISSSRSAALKSVVKYVKYQNDGRDPFIDNVKGFTIFLVVLAHLLGLNRYHRYTLALHLQIFIYMFHMPLFAAISGYFSRAAISDAHFQKTLKATVIPYVLFQSVTCFYQHNIQKGSCFKCDYLVPQWGIWYVFSLFCGDFSCLVFFVYVSLFSGVSSLV
ncbi:hypothetical protein GEMRC1_010522 [Eukaryota sp. GEM-RC1]